MTGSANVWHNFDKFKKFQTRLFVSRPMLKEHFCLKRRSRGLTLLCMYNEHLLKQAQRQSFRNIVKNENHHS